jgi:hypothetical protein
MVVVPKAGAHQILASCPWRLGGWLGDLGDGAPPALPQVLQRVDSLLRRRGDAPAGVAGVAAGLAAAGMVMCRRPWAAAGVVMPYILLRATPDLRHAVEQQQENAPATRGWGWVAY